MNINVTQPMTVYECLAIALSTTAIAIPIISWVYRKFFVVAELDFFPSSDIKIIYNRSGSYIELGGTFQSLKARTVVKQISAEVTRIDDNSKLMLNWSSFISPVFQRIGNQPVTTNETARAFAISEDSLIPVFIEFANKDSGINGKLNNIHRILENESSIYSGDDWNTREEALIHAKEQFSRTQVYIEKYTELVQNFFWLSGTYTLILNIQYNNNKTFIKKYRITISDEEYHSMKKNIENIMLIPLYEKFNLVNSQLHRIYKDFDEEN